MHPQCATEFTLLEFRRSENAKGDEFLITELLRLGSLDAALERHSFCVRCKWEMCTQICEAMQHLSAHHVLHRDLAARNVFIQSLHPVAIKAREFPGCLVLNGDF